MQIIKRRSRYFFIRQESFFILPLLVCLFSIFFQACEDDIPLDKPPFLLGGIQVNEPDYQKWTTELIQSGMNTVEVTVYAYQGRWNSDDLYYAPEKVAAIAEIEAAKQNGLQVVLILRLGLDHIHPENQFLWHGLTFPETEQQLDNWFKTYQDFVLHWAKIAEEKGVQVLGIGSELKSLVATLAVEDIPELAIYYLDTTFQKKYQELVLRHKDSFTEEDLDEMGAKDFLSFQAFMNQEQKAQRSWAKTYCFHGSPSPIDSINKRRRILQEHWEELIDTVREVYSGKLTLAANFDNFHEVGFWDKLDYIGINAYFVLRPSVNDLLVEDSLRSEWSKIFTQVEDFKKEQGLNQSIIFTELGYTQRSKLTVAPWSSKSFVPLFEEDQLLIWRHEALAPKERAMAVRSLYDVWQKEKFPLAGILYWKLSSSLDLQKYEPFMLYLGEEGKDPLYDEIRRFSTQTAPLLSTDSVYSKFEQVIMKGHKKGLTQLLQTYPNPNIPASEIPLLHLAAKYGQKKIIKQLIKKGWNVDLRDESGFLPLHWACYQENPDIIKYLLPSKSISWEDNIGETPFHKCARLDNFALLERLISYRPDLVTKQNHNSQTALWLATDQASVEMVALLVTYATKRYTSNINPSPLHLAVKRNDMQLIKLLYNDVFKYAIDSTDRHPIDDAAYFGREEAFNYLLKPSFPPEEIDSSKILVYAAVGGSLPIVDTLLKLGLDINQTEDSSYTPLYVAVLLEHADLAEFLIKNGANPHIEKDGGPTIVHVAAGHKSDKILRLLYKHKINLNVIDEEGHTALHHAAGWGRLQNMRFLIQAGLPIHAKNKKGQTAYDIARAAQRWNVVAFLESI